ncbi:RPII140-upstream gene protein [Sitophilus oryzae]|uniref:Complex I assembly factor TIMMDC1, mitochondrial n=1 Tax=Sitophilus oryzae TaxID=7048 RepID=A0A6J2YE67_SITOR|nr:RPII140-upstream gene protein [Sitophilus oryzae]
MINLLRKNVKLVFLPFFNQYYAEDNVKNATPTEKKTDTTESQETGWDRVRKVFEVDEFGNVSHEAHTVLQSAAISCFIGFIYGGVVLSRGAYMEFMRNNEATTFKTHLDAKRKLQDKVTIAFGKGAAKFGWRLTLFTTSFVGIATLIQTYNEDYGIMEYVVSGGLTGFMYKFYAGPRACIVGTGLGSALGLMCGAATWSIMKFSGLSLKEARYWQYKWKETKLGMKAAYVKKKWEDDDFAIIKLHDDKMSNEGNTLDSIDEITGDTDVNNK